MKPIIRTVIGVALLLVGLPPRAHSACTNPNSILNSTYGWLAEGKIASGNSQAPKIGDFVPLVQVGHLTFDGNGNVSGAHDTSLGGVLIPHVDSGTYIVNSDCTTGTIVLANGFTMNIVITSGGEEVKFIGATTGEVTAGTLRLTATSCSAGTLGGKSYGYTSDGLVAAGNGNGLPRVGGYVPLADAGQISFGVDGSISGVDNANFGGVVTPGQPVAGTYSVNSDCSGTTTMTIAGVASSWHFVILQGSNQIIFVSTTSGFVWGGTLTED